MFNFLTTWIFKLPGHGRNISDIIDALLTAQYYVGLGASPFNENAADVDCDGVKRIVDALLIAQYHVGLITGFC